MTVIKKIPNPPDPLGGVKGRIFKFRYNSESCQYFYENFAFIQRYKKYETYQTWFSIEGLCPYPPRLRRGVKRSNSTFLEHGHDAYQINENHKCSNVVANIWPADPPPPPSTPPTLWMGSIGQNSLVQNMVMLHIKLKRIKNAPTW